MFICNNCELVFEYPYPSPEFLNKFYSTNYHSKRDYKSLDKVGKLRKEMYDLDYQSIDKNLPISGNFLDYGCAEGTFLNYLSNRWSKFGVDISNESIESAKKIHKNIKFEHLLNNNVFFSGTNFNVIHLRAVLEHVQDPFKVLKKLSARVNEKGYLIISNTPNSSSIGAKLYRQNYRLTLPYEHINIYSMKSMKILMNRLNFKIINVEFPYWGTPYENIVRDLPQFIFNKFLNKKSPPFFKNIFTLYAQKI